MLVLYIILVKEGYLVMLYIIPVFPPIIFINSIVCFVAAFYVAHLIWPCPCRTSDTAYNWRPMWGKVKKN